MRKHGFRYQRTLGRSVGFEGIGFLTGATVRLRLCPAPPSTGVVFVRTDLPPHVRIPATVPQVTGTRRRTTLGHPPAHVGLVEHVLAALAGLRVDNCVVELNAPEPPGFDGSAAEFVKGLRRAGVVIQTERRAIWTVDEPIVVSHAGATLAMHPFEAGGLRVSYLLDYGMGSPIDRQSHTQTVTPESFINDIAPCRTFLLASEAEELRRQGLGSKTSCADLVVFGPHGPIDNTLRFANEPARHKVLDLVGDLSLFGHDLCGHVVAYRSGHELNVELVRALTYEMQQAGEGTVLRKAA